MTLPLDAESHVNLANFLEEPPSHSHDVFDLHEQQEWILKSWVEIVS